VQKLQKTKPEKNFPKLDLLITVILALLMLIISVWGGINDWIGPSRYALFSMWFLVIPLFVIIEGYYRIKKLLVCFAQAVLLSSIFFCSIPLYGIFLKDVVIVLLVTVGMGILAFTTTKVAAYAKALKPELYINITANAGLKEGNWERLYATIMNVGEGIAKDIKLTLSGPIEVGGVKPIPRLNAGEKREIIFAIKPTDHGNLPLEVIISYTDGKNTPFKITDVSYKRIAKEDETVAAQSTTYFNIGSIGEVLGAGAIKTGDIGVVKGDIGSTNKTFTTCPYCGEALNVSKPPKYCPNCAKALR